VDIRHDLNRIASYLETFQVERDRIERCEARIHEVSGRQVVCTAAAAHNSLPRAAVEVQDLDTCTGHHARGSDGDAPRRQHGEQERAPPWKGFGICRLLAGIEWRHRQSLGYSAVRRHARETANVGDEDAIGAPAGESRLADLSDEDRSAAGDGYLVQCLAV